MPDTTANLGLPVLQPAQAQKHVTHNEALERLDALVMPVVQDRDRTAPPAEPAPGQRHIVAAGAAGAWTGQDGAVAVFSNGGWLFLRPAPGWQLRCLAEDAALVFGAGTWSVAGSTGTGGGAARQEMLGLNTDADATNRLAVAADATLLTHEGAGHQLKLNKAAPGDTASLLFQTGWSGRAEMGTAGSDAFAIKVSADGADWSQGVAFDGASGAAAFGPGLTIGGATAYHSGNVLGAVSLDAGAATGALLDRGESADGAWLRLADGTQICLSPALSASAADQPLGALFTAPEITWTFPRAFIAAPALQVHCSGAAGHWANARPGADAGVSALIQGFAATTQGTGATYRAMAVGRWG
ncbi:DUF2793 domain-containing protein [Pseudoroseicyclus aestuarii]|uniref:Uncharacterized protein DUF2793 n=1 Tax=Pseudoroseicyclus aestuarii TaxID=1795041 RepID=A0A318SRS7_9RHOB|nr:DUF2793 domain-containing protein [Pseudoroseicyclus aestuarii]PYE84520.1 uncharacterized protein DUF2793 [Pseudoroseicyclus aestuarii]